MTFSPPVLRLFILLEINTTVPRVQKQDQHGPVCLFVYYKSIKRELKTRPIYDCRCDERLKPKGEESTCLTYTGLLGELEYLKIETRLIDEKFASVMGECVI